METSLGKSLPRDGVWAELAVAELVPGDIVRVGTGDVVPADVRLIEVHDLECDEAILTGESEPGAKTIAPVLGAAAAAVAPVSCALMGTNVRTGWARGVVVTAGSATAFGAIGTIWFAVYGREVVRTKT